MPDISRDAGMVPVTSWMKVVPSLKSGGATDPPGHLMAPMTSAARVEASDDADRLPAGVAATVVIVLSLGLWALIITVVLWLIRVS
jgi:hypothetical protein